MGFISFPGEKFKLMGFSLGGAHAMRDCCLYLDQVSQLVTLCAAGIDSATLKWFQTASESKQDLSIVHIVELDDKVHLMGRGRLGLGCKPENVKIDIYGILPTIEETGIQVQTGKWPDISVYGYIVLEAFGLVRALKGPHIRHTFKEDNCIVFHVNNQTDDPALLKAALDNKSHATSYHFEHMRKKIAIGDKHVLAKFLEDKNRSVQKND